MSLDIATMRELNPAVLAIGSHPGILQSIIDFDFLCGRDKPSIKAIIASGRKQERYFFGSREVLVPVYEAFEDVPGALRNQINLFINLSSGRRVLASTKTALDNFPSIVGGTIFAERLPERHALELYELSRQKNVWIVGGSSVGVLVADQLKLGAIGGIEASQLVASNLFTDGQIAVVSTSGGMVNEIIRLTATSGYGLSFAVALGGERFPLTTPKEVFLAAEQDPATKAIAYFGEIGGNDEQELADMMRDGHITKPVVAYIAGTVAELFEVPPQFGHAKAMAAKAEETASAKRKLLKEQGVLVGESFGQFVESIKQLPLQKVEHPKVEISQFGARKPSLIASSVSYDVDKDVHVLGQDLLTLVNGHSFAYIAASMFLGRPLKSKETEEFVDFVLRLLVDHGPYVSGAMNTIVTARAGRDLVSSLAAGLLTIGPRFGGAINEAANIWIQGVRDDYEPAKLVEEFASRKEYISGIGHRKYRSDNPDPRVAAIDELTKDLERRRFTAFAKAVEKETLQKKGNLILNVDGAIAAGLLDILSEKEGYSIKELEELAKAGLFNALFVLSRSVGFMAHYFDQVRLDEGLFRLTPDQVTRVD